MKRRLLLTAFILSFLTVCSAQQTPKWDNWSWLIGEWTGEGSGQPGQGSGKFTFAFDLNKKVLIRKSHSEYPGTGDNTRVIHDDLMIVYPDSASIPSKAVYFDNEGHTIFYSVSFQDKKILLTSQKSGNVPAFRLIYTLIDAETVNTEFQISRDGINFGTYIEGKSKRNQ